MEGDTVYPVGSYILGGVDGIVHRGWIRMFRAQAISH
jgi:hypothetical protein